MSGNRAVNATSMVLTSVSNLIVSSDATWMSFLSGCAVLDLLELVGELLEVVLIALLRDRLLILVGDEVEPFAVHQHDQLEDLLRRRVLTGLALPLLVRLEARQLGPDRGDEEERHHAGQKVDVRNQVQVGVERTSCRPCRRSRLKRPWCLPPYAEAV